MIRVLNLEFLFFLIQTANVLAQNIRGQVADEESRSLPYANIGITDANKGTGASEAGTYNFEDLTACQHEDIVSFKGFEKYVQKMTLREGEAVEAINQTFTGNAACVLSFISREAIL